MIRRSLRDCAVNHQDMRWVPCELRESPKFAGGKALTVILAFSCGESLCSDGFVEQTIQLRGGPKQ